MSDEEKVPTAELLPELEHRIKLMRDVGKEPWILVVCRNKIRDLQEYVDSLHGRTEYVIQQRHKKGTWHDDPSIPPRPSLALARDALGTHLREMGKDHEKAFAHCIIRRIEKVEDGQDFCDELSEPKKAE